MSDFEIAIKIVLNHEGGYVNNSDDRGGETKFGISKRSFPELNIRELTIDQAKNIYKKEYWNNIQGDKINYQELANKLFDIAVLTGNRTAIKLLQKSIKDEYNVDIIIDGIMGPQTLGYINGDDKKKIYHAFLYSVEKYLKNLNRPKYINGWLSRLYS